MNIHRHIAGLLLFCFSAFLGHNLVPHHHFAEDFQSSMATACPLDHGDHQGHDRNSEEHPTHCHAFNDVVFEKYNAYASNARTSQVQIVFNTGQAWVPEVPGVLALNQSTHLILPFKSCFVLGTRALRAPPLFA